jgi:BirA family biotin operon repressor/biotin-[acetyl-CoA-carboxylase] ligase
MNILIAENIGKQLERCGVSSGLDITVHETIDSTNSWVLKECKAGRSLPFACFAEQQTAGRGRRGKTWLMLERNNIAMSVAWPFLLLYQDLKLLPLSIAIAIAETLESLNLKNVQIKWPNDVYVDGVKIAGVLIETQVLKNGAYENNISSKNSLAVVIGIGLNYDMRKGVPQKLLEMEGLVLTDICSELERQGGVAKLSGRPDRLMIASKLLKNVIHTCEIYQGNISFALSVFRQKYDYCQNKWVNIILDDQSVVSGVAKGVTDGAELIVEIDGEQQVFNSAEVSVKTGDGCR